MLNDLPEPCVCHKIPALPVLAPLVTVDLTVDGTKITYDSSRFVVITGGNALSAHAGGRKIRRIVGLF